MMEQKLKHRPLNWKEQNICSKNNFDSFANVLQNDLVLKHIFEFLDLSDVKNCRLVHSKWKSVLEPIFKRRGQLFFDFHNCEDENCISLLNNCNYTKNVNDVPKKLDKFFCQSPTEFPFNGLRLRGPLPWETVDLSQFFRNEGNFLEELSLQKVTFFDGECHQIRRIDFFPMNIKKLSISTDCKIPLQLLSSIPSIKIFNSTIIVGENEEDENISPRDLNLAFVSFSKRGNLVQEVLINDFVDFRQIQTLHLGRFDVSTDVIIDLDGDVSLSSLSLDSVNVKNWEHSKWDSRKVILNSVPFQSQNEMRIKSLDVVSSSVDFSCLPKTVEKLCLSFSEVIAPLNPLALNMPNLNYVILKDWNPRGDHRRIEYNLQYFPNNIRIMELQHVFFSGEHVFHVETLVLHRYSIDDMKELLKVLRPANLLISTKFKNVSADELMNVLVSASNSKQYKFVAAGKFKWANVDFSLTNFSKIVNKKASYYCFKNDVIQDIEEVDFKRLVKQIGNDNNFPNGHLNIGGKMVAKREKEVFPKSQSSTRVKKQSGLGNKFIVSAAVISVFIVVTQIFWNIL